MGKVFFLISALIGKNHLMLPLLKKGKFVKPKSGGMVNFYPKNKLCLKII